MNDKSTSMREGGDSGNATSSRTAAAYQSQSQQEIATALNAAADLLMANGWCKGSFRKVDAAGHERFCVLGAIQRVTPTSFGGTRHAVICAFESFIGCPAARFNDEYATRRKVVVAKLREAAQIWIQKAEAK